MLLTEHVFRPTYDNIVLLYVLKKNFVCGQWLKDKPTNRYIPFIQTIMKVTTTLVVMAMTNDVTDDGNRVIRVWERLISLTVPTCFHPVTRQHP